MITCTSLCDVDLGLFAFTDNSVNQSHLHHTTLAQAIKKKASKQRRASQTIRCVVSATIRCEKDCPRNFQNIFFVYFHAGSGGPADQMLQKALTELSGVISKAGHAVTKETGGGGGGGGGAGGGLWEIIFLLYATFKLRCFLKRGLLLTFRKHTCILLSQIVSPSCFFTLYKICKKSNTYS